MGWPAAAHPGRTVTGSGDGSRSDSHTEPDDGVVDTSDLPADAADGPDDRVGEDRVSGQDTAPEPATGVPDASDDAADPSAADPSAADSAADTTTDTDDSTGESGRDELDAGESASEEPDEVPAAADVALPVAAPVVSGTDADTDTDPEAGDPAAAGRLGKWARRGVVLLAVLAVVLLGTTVWAAIVFLGDRSLADREASALETARTAGAVLTTIDQATAEQDIQKVVDVSTGQFGDLFRSNTQAYVGVVQEGAVSSTGKVEEAGLQSVDGDTAKALVAVSSTVKNKAVPDGEPRYYRMLIGMQHQDDGRWLVSQVEFVP